MPKSTDIRCVSVSLHFLPVSMRVPLKFGAQVVTAVTCARARVRVADHHGRVAEGWGETPLSASWAWPGQLDYEARHTAMKDFCALLAKAWSGSNSGHPIEIGHDFLEQRLPKILEEFNQQRMPDEPMPWLAALICCSLFDIAVHDAYGMLHRLPVYQTYNRDFMSRDLSDFLDSAEASVDFSGRFPEEFRVLPPAQELPAWHLVGGLDPIDDSELAGNEPGDGYPVTLVNWIERDGLKCLKIKLRGNDPDWDYRRLVKVGLLSLERRITALSADFNCTVTDPAYVNEILDRLAAEHPRISGLILYVEQPFPYELEHHRIDVRSVAQRKPLFLDESAHDWRLIRLGRELGWTGVALKTCKTQTGALLSLCWAKAHGMQLMVQDLTNPMLAQIPHVLLAAHAGTIMGVETNGMQFYPEASAPEQEVHPGIYLRRNGAINLSSLRGGGFGYRLNEIQRDLPEAVC